MPFAVELLLDRRAAVSIRGVWEALRDAGVNSAMLDAGSRPHVTLAVYQDLDPVPFETQVQAFFATETSIDVPLSGVGTFAGTEGVIYCSPVVTPELLALHQRFHRRFDHLAEGAWAYYRPGCWVPHCTLAIHVAEEQRGKAIDVVLASDLPARTRLGGVSVVAFEPGVPGTECFEASFGV
jgi:2'-5' RNA ligase